jgi:hypothetical protein
VFVARACDTGTIEKMFAPSTLLIAGVLYGLHCLFGLF